LTTLIIPASISSASPLLNVESVKPQFEANSEAFFSITCVFSERIYIQRSLLDGVRRCCLILSLFPGSFGPSVLIGTSHTRELLAPISWRRTYKQDGGQILLSQSRKFWSSDLKFPNRDEYVVVPFHSNSALIRMALRSVIIPGYWATHFR